MILKPTSRRPGKAAPLPLPESGPSTTAVVAPVPGGKPLAALPPSLPQQKADFTAEGSPPPGKVATTAPVRKGDPD